MKGNSRFVDSDMHVIEPPDLFEKYLDKSLRHRVTIAKDSHGTPHHGGITGGLLIDGLPLSADVDLQQYRKPNNSPTTDSTTPALAGSKLSGSRMSDAERLGFAVERNYDPVAQVMAMDIEGIDIAVLFPSQGLTVTARNDMDPQLSLGLCQAYNNWISEFCSFSPDQLKFAALLPLHDVNLACQELVRSVNELNAVGSIIRPNLINGRYWHSNYWKPLYRMHEELNVAWAFHESTGAWYSHMNVLYGENRFYRHVASHWIEMQQALIAQIIGGVFEFHPNLRVGFLEAQNSWVPGLLSRIEWDYPNFRNSHAPYLSLTPKEYFRNNCWAAVEGSEPEIEATASLIGSDRMCISTDYPHFDSNFPYVSSNLVNGVSNETASNILFGGANLYGFNDTDFKKSDAAMINFKKSIGSTT